MPLDAILIKTPKAVLHRPFDGIEAVDTTHPLHAKDLAFYACMEGRTLICAAGGDGVVNEVANGIFQAEANKDVTLAVIASGSGNDFARSLGIFSEEDSYRALGIWQRRVVDAGRATYYKSNGKKGVAWLLVGGSQLSEVRKSSSVMKNNSGSNLTKHCSKPPLHDNAIPRLKT